MAPRKKSAAQPPPPLLPPPPPAAPPPVLNTLVLDNGAYSIKAGFAQPDHAPDVEADCHVVPNALGKGTNARNQTVVYVGDELNGCTDFGQMSFRRPMERGFIVNWDAQLDVWKQAVFNDGAKLHCDPHDTNLILTEAPNCPLALQSNCDQIIFEECEFVSALRCTAASLNAYNDVSGLVGEPATAEPRPSPAECFLHVDIGYSHTVVTPVYQGRPLKAATRRLDVAGKVLTNHLTHRLSLQHYDLSAEPYMVSQVKEDVCYTSPSAQQFRLDLDKTWHRNPKARTALNDVVVDYVLPNWRTTTRGRVRAHDPTLTSAQRMAADRAKKERNEPIEQYFPVANERFTVPELVFAPTDIGLDQAGLPEVMVQSLAALPSGLWPVLLANVVVTGGTALIPGLVTRLERELRALAPAQCVVRVRSPADPVRWTWLGGARLAGLDGGARLREVSITKAEYDEHGSGWATRRFNGTSTK